MPAKIKDYSDLDLSFALHAVTGDVARLTSVNAVKRAVQYLVLTNFYERPFQPALACGIRETLFEPMTTITAQKIQLIITNAIETYEPRVALEEVRVALDPDNNGYRVDITFHILNLSDAVELSLFLERIR